jgi:hypothetical protein
MAIFHKRQGDEEMTIEQHIEELRAELRNTPTIEERQQIETELKAAIEELTEKEVPD